MTQFISKEYLMDHVLDVECGDGTYQEAVLLEDIYEAPVFEADKLTMQDRLKILEVFLESQLNEIKKLIDGGAE